MFPALLTTILWSFSVIFAARSARLVGGQTANLARLILAALLLGVWAHVWGVGVSGPSFNWFFLSGVIGFGFGDIALFGALTRVGPRLSILLTHCLATPIASIAEWSWLGTRLTSAELAAAAVILVGVALALKPEGHLGVDRRVFWIGVLCGVGSALGQALGSVVSRKAYQVAEAAQFSIDGGSAAYQRILAGLLVTALCMVFIKPMRPTTRPAPEAFRRGFIFIAANALVGPALGVACFQWALGTTPSGIVLPIVATSPLVTMLFTWAIDGDRPGRRATIGGVLAVAGAVALKIFSGSN